MKHSLCLLLTLPLILAITPLSRAQPHPSHLHYTIIITGNELLEGAYADSHTLFLTRLLQPHGWRCAGSLSIGDHHNDLLHALQFAASNAPVILVTGGLGPTPNDITRQTIAGFTHIQLQENPDLLRSLSQHLNQPPDRLPENLRQQCRVPTRGLHFPNPNGTAAGLVFHTGTHSIIALPGPPGELRPMAADHLLPYLQHQFGNQPPGLSLTIRFAGVRQSFVIQKLEEHLTLPAGIRISSDFDGSRVDFTFNLPAAQEEDREKLTLLGTQVQGLLGPHIYGQHFSGTRPQSLEEEAARALGGPGAKVVLADAGTDGLLAAGLCALPQALTVLAGACTARSEQDVAHLLGIPAPTWNRWKPGAERARGLAQYAAAQTGAAWAVGIGEITPLNNQTNLAWVAIRSPEPAWTLRKITLPAWDQRQPHSLATDILHSLRQQALARNPAH